MIGFLKAYLLELYKELKNSYRNYKLVSRYKKANLHIAIASNCTIINSKFEGNNSVNRFGRLAHTSVGRWSYIQSNCNIGNCEIGKFCSIGPNTIIAQGEHPISEFSTAQVVAPSSHQFHNRVTIGHDVWIGAGCYIKDGVTIGIGAIIGAGAVVTKDVEPYAIVGGVPAKLIRFRFSPQVITKLLKSQWWNLPIEEIKTFTLESLIKD